MEAHALLMTWWLSHGEVSSRVACPTNGDSREVMRPRRRLEIPIRLFRVPVSDPLEQEDESVHWPDRRQPRISLMFAQPAGQRASLQLLQQLCIESPQLGHLETLYAEFLQQSREDAGVCAWTRQWFVLGRPTRDLPLSVKLQPAESDMVRVMWGW